VSRSQDIFNNATGGDFAVSQEDFKNQEKNIGEDRIEVREDWQAKKIWKNHQSKSLVLIAQASSTSPGHPTVCTWSLAALTPRSASSTLMSQCHLRCSTPKPMD
jgi:hypothetical protein